MKATKSDLILEARMAFDAGDTRRGSSILHEILQDDIAYAPAWKLLHGALNRSDSLNDFQLEFVSKYYPDRVERFLSESGKDGSKGGANGPYRRVSLLGQAQPVVERKPAARGPIPTRASAAETASQRIAEEAVTAAGSEALDTAAKSPPRERIGLLGRLRRVFARRKNRKEKAAEAQPEAQRTLSPPGLGSKFAPISLKDLPQKPAPEAPVKERRRGREEPAPILSKLHEEHFEIRLLIADDIQQTRENIRKLLKFEPSVDVVGVAAHGAEAVELALKHEPDIVLMDINMPGMDGLAALKTIREKLPLTQVIMLTVQDDPGYLREALQFGARDYLIKPPTIDELLQTIQKTHEIGKSERERLSRLYAPPKETITEIAEETNGFAVAVYSPKGGVGCTFLATNLAVAAQAEDRPVVLVDCDLQYGGVGLFFNEQARSSIVDLAPRITEPDRALLQDAIVTHPGSGVRLVLAPIRLEQAEQVAGPQLVDLINYLKKTYPVVVVDTGSSLDGRMADVLAACDQVLVVLTQDIPAINEVRQLLDFSSRIGLDESKISLVINQYHKRINISEEQISKNLRRPIAAVVPLDNRTAVPSINRGIPFMLDPDHRALPIGSAVQTILEHVLDRQTVAV